MHGPRVPSGNTGATMDLDGPKIIHLQYIDWERMRAKQRWYQAQERIEFPGSGRSKSIGSITTWTPSLQASDTISVRTGFKSYELDDGMDLLAFDPQPAYPPERASA